jgi:hypothetical protein
LPKDGRGGTLCSARYSFGAGDALAERIGDLTTLINKTALAIVSGVGSIAEAGRPKKIDAEFSVAFSGEAGIWYITKASASTSIKVTLHWEHNG